MRFLITSVSGKKGYKSFKNLNEYVEFMTKKGHLVKDLKEADLPYTDKPVKLPKVSKSNGWSEVTDFGEVGEESEKGESLIASTSKSVMKDEASFEMSKSSGKADKSEMGLGAEKGDVDMSDFKSFEYEEPKLKSSETKESAPKSEEPKSEEKSEPKKEESKEDKKDSNESSKKEEKKDESKKHDKDIEECLKNAGVKLDEGIKDYLPRAGFIRDDDEDKSSSKMGIWGGQGTDDQLRKAKIIAKVKFANGDRMGRVTSEDLKHFDEYKAQYDEIYGSDKLDESKEDNTKLYSDNKSARYEANNGKKEYAIFWDTSSYAADNYYEKVSLDYFSEDNGFYPEDKKAIENLDVGEMYSLPGPADTCCVIKLKSPKLDEGWKDKLKKGAATLGVAASLAGNAMAHDPMYDGATRPFEDTDMNVQQVQQLSDEDEKAIRLPNGMIKDQYGNEWTPEDWKKLMNGEDPYADNDDVNESEDEMIDVDISECLKAAGVQLNEFFHFDGPDPDDESKESDDEKTYKKYMKKEISDDEARSELKKQGYKGKKAKNLVKNAKSKRDSK